MWDNDKNIHQNQAEFSFNMGLLSRDSEFIVAAHRVNKSVNGLFG